MIESIKDISTDELLYELIQRHGQDPAPIKTKRYGVHWETIVPIGKDNICKFTLTDDDMDRLVERITAQQLVKEFSSDPFNLVMEAIKKERQHQDEKWGSLDEKNQSIAGFLQILQGELYEAQLGWLKNREGRHSALAEILQVATVAVACLEQHGLEGN